MPIMPVLWVGEVDKSLEARSSRPVGQHNKTLVFTKNLKINQVWWYMPVVPVTWEAEPGGLLEPRSWRQELEAAVSHDRATALQPG